ncbi:nidogen-2 [Platysternon megacephalum]|uniref:Nidogen-2 n=1 Tax=Platysternon megacephalum TaxID=55544 RepID=A0A4D9E3U7_9SAUR|nr:nidogen-2 [Platysternon megacephalum]
MKKIHLCLEPPDFMTQIRSRTDQVTQQGEKWTSGKSTLLLSLPESTNRCQADCCCCLRGVLASDAEAFSLIFYPVRDVYSNGHMARYGPPDTDRLHDCNIRSRTAYYLDNGWQEQHRIWMNHGYGASWMDIR